MLKGYLFPAAAPPCAAALGVSRKGAVSLLSNHFSQTTDGLSVQICLQCLRVISPPRRKPGERPSASVRLITNFHSFRESQGKSSSEEGCTEQSPIACLDTVKLSGMTGPSAVPAKRTADSHLSRTVPHGLPQGGQEEQPLLRPGVFGGTSYTQRTESIEQFKE